MAARTVTVFGASGFVGRHIVRALAKRGWRIRAAVRRPDKALFLQPLGDVGQIHAVQANLRYPDSVRNALQGVDAAINLVGILQPKGAQQFETIQAQGAACVAREAKALGIKTLVHVSAIGADADSPSVYARSKAQGEASVQEHCPAATILRPSVVFGPQDQFFNRFASLSRVLPVLPIAGADTLFQPVSVEDVAEAALRVLENPRGAIYELGGPDIQPLRELVAYAMAQSGRSRPILPLPAGIASIQAGIMEVLDTLSLGLLPEDFKLTRDQILLLQKDNVVSRHAQLENRTLQGLGITPTGYEAVVPSYLVRFRRKGQFDKPASPEIV